MSIPYAGLTETWADVGVGCLYRCHQAAYRYILDDISRKFRLSEDGTVIVYVVGVQVDDRSAGVAG